MACRYSHIVAESHASEDYSSGTYPAIIAYRDRLCICFAKISFCIGVEVRAGVLFVTIAYCFIKD